MMEVANPMIVVYVNLTNALSNDTPAIVGLNDRYSI